MGKGTIGRMRACGTRKLRSFAPSHVSATRTTISIVRRFPSPFARDDFRHRVFRNGSIPTRTLSRPGSRRAAAPRFSVPLAFGSLPACPPPSNESGQLSFALRDRVCFGRSRLSFLPHLLRATDLRLRSHLAFSSPRRACTSSMRSRTAFQMAHWLSSIRFASSMASVCLATCAQDDERGRRIHTDGCATWVRPNPPPPSPSLCRPRTAYPYGWCFVHPSIQLGRGVLGTSQRLGVGWDERVAMGDENRVEGTCAHVLRRLGRARVEA